MRLHFTTEPVSSENRGCDLTEGWTTVHRQRTDRCYRLGGEEFAVLLTDLPEGDPAGVPGMIEERLVDALADHLRPGVSASQGMVIRKAGETQQQLMRRADKAMYEAKNASKR